MITRTRAQPRNAEISMATAHERKKTGKNRRGYTCRALLLDDDGYAKEYIKPDHRRSGRNIAKGRQSKKFKDVGNK